MKRFLRLLLISSLLVLALVSITACKKPETKKINIDYNNMTYVGSSLKNFSSFFDEQDVADPKNGNLADVKSSIASLDSDYDGDIDDADKSHFFELTIDLKAQHYVECIYVYYPLDNGKITIQTGTPFKYEDSFSATCISKWNRIDIDTETRYINVLYENSLAPSEILVYGAQTGEDEKINTEPTDRKTMNYLIGMNANVNTIRTDAISSSNYIRDYVNWLWCYLHKHVQSLKE